MKLQKSGEQVTVTTYRSGHSGSLVVDTALTSVPPLIWGTTYIVTTQFLPEGVPLASAALRALPAAVLLLLLAPGLMPKGWWGKTAVLGVLNIGLFFPLLFVAAYRLPGGIAAVVGSIQPLVIAALAAALGWGRTSRQRVVWLVLAAVGVSMTVLTGEGSVDGIGVIAAVAGTVSMACGILLTRRWGTPPGVRPLTMTGWQLLVGGLLIVPFAPLLDTGSLVVDVPAAWGYIWLAVAGGAVAYALWFRGARVLPATSTSLLGLLSPLAAAALDWAILNESMTWVQVTGFVVALGSAYFAQRPTTVVS